EIGPRNIKAPARALARGLRGGAAAGGPEGGLLAAALLGVDRFLEVLARLEADGLAGLDGDRLAGGGVAPLAGTALGDGEAAEARGLDRLTGLQRVRDRADDRFESCSGLPPGHPLDRIHNTIHEISLTSHRSPPLSRFFERK